MSKISNYKVSMQDKKFNGDDFYFLCIRQLKIVDMEILAQPLQKFNGRNKTLASEAFQKFPDIYADVGFVFVNTKFTPDFAADVVVAA